MRVLAALTVLTALTIGANASSIVFIDQTKAELQSLEVIPAPQETDPDIIPESDNSVLKSSPSVVMLGGPAPAEPEAAADAKEPAPVVLRGGIVGGAFPPPPPVAPPSEPALLDPNDAGTPAKRKALKEQARRLQEEAAAAEASPEQPASEQPAQ